MGFYKAVVRVDALIDTIYRLEIDNLGAYYKDTPNGLHFNTCTWASNDLNGTGIDVVGTCACVRIHYATEQCINLLNSMGLNKK